MRILCCPVHLREKPFGKPEGSPTGECWPVVALFAKGITNNCPSRSETNCSVLGDKKSKILTPMH